MYVGIDHSTTGIKVTCLGDDHPEHAFRIDRREVDDGSVLAALAEHVDPDDVTLATMTYSWANGISEIVDIERPSNRGVKDYTGLGYETGAGARTYDQLRSSSIPTVVLPGVHDGLDTLHPYFKHYSTLAGADKVADMRYALERARKAGADGNVIWACASSSCMAGLISEGELRGFFHWMGPVHGWPDPQAIREGEDDGFEDVFMQCGIVPRSGQEVADVHDITDPEIFEKVYWATMQNVYSLYPFADMLGPRSLDAIVLTGRLMRREQPMSLGRRVYEQCLDLAPTFTAEPYSAAHGAALVARDVARGADEVLGIPVGAVPASLGQAEPAEDVLDQPPESDPMQTAESEADD
ncbi:hypothetical protein QA599_18240 [Haloarculaceae archaeon H-GB1-1]|nr:hypothetical protein [Haloarculaceae archaeon H-GB1-1]